MTLTQLQYFLSIVDTGSFTRAAEENFVAQPAISHAIKALEAELGGRLLQRSTRNVALTEAGAWFYEEAQEIVRRLEAARRQVARLSASRQGLVIGYSSLANTDDFLQLIEKFRMKNPDASIQLVRQDMSLRLFDGLMAGELDAVYCYQLAPVPDASIETLTLGSERRYVLLPRDHRLAGRATLAMEELREETLLIFKQNPLPSPPEHFQHARTAEAADIESMELLISAHVGIAILPVSNESKFKTLVKIPLLEEGSPETDRTRLILAWVRHSANPLLDSFIQAVRPEAVDGNL